MTKNQRVQMGLGVAWMILGVWWGLVTSVWVGSAFFVLGVVQVVSTLRRAKTNPAP